ncbi:MAG: HDIG domain-containing protein [Cyanothece sp. SIO1E1]|nr:HDIG domain-containing protein [Cyanothece sp. SIO1E1]
MKSLRSLTKRVNQWWQVYCPNTPDQAVSQCLDQVARKLKTYPKAAHLHKLWSQLFTSEAQCHNGSASSRPALQRTTRSTKVQHPRAALILTILTLTAAMGQRFYDEPKLDVGTIAPQTLKAPKSENVIDTDATEEKRKTARSGAIRVLMIDQEANLEIYQALQRWVDQGSELRKQAGAMPFFPTSSISTVTQQYLRQVKTSELQALLGGAPVQSNLGTLEPKLDGSLEPLARKKAAAEIQAYRLRVTPQQFADLRVQINQAREKYAQGLAALQVLSKVSGNNALGNTIVGANKLNPFDLTLFNLSDAEWRETRSGIRQAAQRISTQGIPQGLPRNILQESVSLQVESTVPAVASPLATQLLLSVLRPNLVEDPEQTRLQAEQAAEAVEPVIISISRGEVIVHGGEEITSEDFVLLDHFGLSRRGINWQGFIGFGVLISGAVTVFLLIEHFFHPSLRRRDYILIMLLTLSTPVLAAVGVTAVSLPAVGLLMGSFYGSVLTATVVGLLAVTLPVGIGIGSIPIVASAIGGVVGGLIAGRLRSREELALLGGAVGLTQGLTYLLLTLILNPAASPVWYWILTDSLLQGGFGIAWSIVALGISPYLEHVFDLVTTVRLAELSNPNRPLLKRLAAEAPGTFQHTLFVANLAEAAALALGCNVELVRAGTLYHDIGKMHDPLGFIENQMGGPNKHDTIANPWKSAAIIKKHVSEGLVMARKHRLPKAIQAFIPEHQGAMLITYFHHQAQQKAQAEPNIVLNEADFRYDGPIPQTRETGIVMLADSCEAALRSLKNATPDEALAMVNRILRARWKDKQLIDCGLTREEMSKIAEIFVRVWQQSNHQRIAYPKAVLSPR